MKLTPTDLGLLDALASMPFIDRLEAVAVTGSSRGAVYEGFSRLEHAGLAASVPHASGLIPPTRRYRITADGLRRLAESGDATVDELLVNRPVSAQWLRLAVDRIDALAVVYRLASALANREHPISLRLYRASPLDAALTLPGGKTVGIVRQGPTADRSAFSRRLWKLRQVPLPGVVLILVTDEVRLRHARQRTPRAVNALLALERDAVLSTSADRVWRPAAYGAPIDLRDAVERLAPGGQAPEEDPPSKIEMPGDGVPDPSHALPALLSPAEKRALDLVSDWPWIQRGELASLMAVSEPRASQLTTPLEGFGLVAKPIEGSGRMALTDRGLSLVSRRDRTSVAVARRRWSVTPLDYEEPLQWRNVTGGRSRQLLRNIEHTQAVHSFVAALARQAHSLGWELHQIDPPRRASRHFRHDGRNRSINPDAFGVLSRGPAVWPFFLEWERRAVRPSTMADRIAPYLRYFSSHRPTDDHGAEPAVLIVFDDRLAAIHFLKVAREEMQVEQVEVPLWVSHRKAIDELGPLGRAWRRPADEEPAQPLLER